MENCCLPYQNGRKHADFKQESAAAFLAIDERTLRAYEYGTSPVPDDVAIKMVDLYKDKRLGYLHARLSQVVQLFLPELEDVTLSQAALALCNAFEDYEDVRRQMMKVCADGTIESAEEGQWNEVNEAIEAVIKAAFTLLLAPKDKRGNDR